VTPKAWIICGAVLGGFSVALGAFGAHGLESALRGAKKPAGTGGSVDVEPSSAAKQGLAEPELAKRLAQWETAARYHMYHALAILAAAWLLTRGGGPAANVAGWCFLLGVLIFSGCLYALVLSGARVLGAIVPVGGVLLIVGWVALAIAGWKSSNV
jgi:uncharacterized membrane protein YgdD (TMEM256/DUF423 family)